MPRQHLAFATCGLLLAATMGAAQAETLKFAYFAPDDEAAYALVLKPWFERINADAGESLKIVGYPNGALGRALPQQPQMVLDGVADIAWLVISTTPGRFPDTAALELPGLYENAAQASRVNNRVLQTVPIPGFEGYRILAGFGSAPLSVYTAGTKCDLASLRGLKLRVTTPTDGQVLSQIGAVPIQIPINEVTEAMGRRTIDGAVSNPQTLFDFGFNRVTRCSNQTKMSSALLVLAMNKAKYDSLQPAARAVLDKYSGDWLADRYATEINGFVEGLNQKLKQDPQQSFVEPGEAARKKLDDAYAVVRAKVIQSRPLAGRILEAIEKAKVEFAGR